MVATIFTQLPPSTSPPPTIPTIKKIPTALKNRQF